MTLESLVSKYIAVTESVFTEITVSDCVSSIDKEKIEGVIDQADTVNLLDMSCY